MSHDSDASCGCVPAHRPPPLELHSHHIWPEYLGGPDTPNNRIWLCPTTHANVHELIRLMLLADRPLTESELEHAEPRPVSRYAARLARRGFTEYQSARTA